ncbi:MAG: hypothetical protein U0M22_01395 [Acutalibacteraceae bacterium]|nr:hypothetical protein [Acutalibacteraceae bacterium]
MIGLSKSQARRFLLLKHGLLGPYRFRGKNGALEYVRQAGCIQFDPVDVCGKNAELVLQARNIWYEDGVRETKALRANVERCMRRFAAFNGCAQLAMPGGPDVPV